jgi:uncharacterized membrane protein
MNQSRYLESLAANLYALPEGEVNDIINEIDMHFAEAIKDERLEKDIIDALGKPKDFALDILSTYDLSTKYPVKRKNKMGVKVLSIGFRSALILAVLSSFALTIV